MTFDSQKYAQQRATWRSILLALSVWHGANLVTAQNNPSRIPEPLQTPSGPVYVYADLHDSLLYAGNQNAFITIYVEGLVLRDFILDEQYFNKRPVRGPLDDDFEFDDGRERGKFECSFGISEKTAPRKHNVKLRFQAPRRTLKRELDLLIPIGVRTEGGLKPGDLSDLINAEPHVLGEPFTLSIPLVNEFYEYAVTIHEANLTLEDATVWDSTNVETLERPIPPLDKNSDVTLYLHPKKLSIWSLLSGWDGETKASLSMSYDDGNGRLLRDFKVQIPIRLRVGLTTLLLFVAAGGLLGGFLNVTYQIYSKQKRWRDPQHLTYLLLAVLLGGATFFIAFLGEIKIEALELKADPRIPIVALVIGLLSGLKGPALLIRYFPQPAKPSEKISEPETSAPPPADDAEEAIADQKKSRPSQKSNRSQEKE